MIGVISFSAGGVPLKVMTPVMSAAREPAAAKAATKRKIEEFS